MAKTAFVTGANGFLGLNLTAELVDQGWNVVAMHRASSDIDDLKRFRSVERVVGDITEFKTLQARLPSAVDAVFHVAGNTSLWAKSSAEQMKVNVKGTRNMVRAALEAKAKRFVHTSSVVAYGLHGGTVTEETPTRGTNAKINYVRTKALAEREVRRGVSQGLRACIVNPANIIGPYDTQNWSRLFLLVQKGRLPGMPRGGGSFCHSREVARAHVAAAERGKVGGNYLLGGADASYVMLVQQMAKVLGKRQRAWTLPAKLLRGYARMEELIATLFGREPDVTRDAVSLLSANIYCSSRRAIQELGYKPVSLERMLEDCYRWMVEGKLIKAS